MSDALPENMRRIRLPGGFQLPPFGLHQGLALIIVGVGLWLVGSVWLGLQAGQQWVGGWKDQVALHVYFPQDNEAGWSKAQTTYEGWNGIASVELLPIDAGHAWLQTWLGDSSLDTSAIAARLPRVLVLQLTEHEDSEFLFADIRDEAERLGGFANDDEIHLASMHQYLQSIEWLILFITALLALAMALIISNTLRMMQLARKDEMGLMRLMGAKEWFVRLPFLLEGAVLGGGSGLLGWLLLWPMAWTIASFTEQSLANETFALLLPLVLLGLISGCTGAWVSTIHGIEDQTEQDGNN